MKYELERTQKNTFLGKKNMCLYTCTCICDLIHDCMLMDGDVCSVSRVRSLPSLPYSDPIGTY